MNLEANLRKSSEINNVVWQMRAPSMTEHNWALSGATKTDLPPGVLYRVQATYRYVKEDVDELSFDVGDTIRVIEYEDPEDQVGS